MTALTYKDQAFKALDTVYSTRDHFRAQLGHAITNVQSSHSKVRRLREQLIFAEQELRKYKDERDSWNSKLETISCLISDIEFVPANLEEDNDEVTGVTQQAVNLVSAIEEVLGKPDESKPESDKDT